MQRINMENIVVDCCTIDELAENLENSENNRDLMELLGINEFAEQQRKDAQDLSELRNVEFDSPEEARILERKAFQQKLHRDLYGDPEYDKAKAEFEEWLTHPQDVRPGKVVGFRGYCFMVPKNWRSPDGFWNPNWGPC